MSGTDHERAARAFGRSPDPLAEKHPVSRWIVVNSSRLERLLGWAMGLGLGVSLLSLIVAAALEQSAPQSVLQNVFFVLVIAGFVVGLVLPLLLAGPIAAMTISPWAGPFGLLFTLGVLAIPTGATGLDEELLGFGLPGGWAFGMALMWVGAFGFWLMIKPSRRKR